MLVLVLLSLVGVFARNAPAINKRDDAEAIDRCRTCLCESMYNSNGKFCIPKWRFRELIEGSKKATHENKLPNSFDTNFSTTESKCGSVNERVLRDGKRPMYVPRAACLQLQHTARSQVFGEFNPTCEDVSRHCLPVWDRMEMKTRVKKANPPPSRERDDDAVTRVLSECRAVKSMKILNDLMASDAVTGPQSTRDRVPWSSEPVTFGFERETARVTGRSDACREEIFHHAPATYKFFGATKISFQERLLMKFEPLYCANVKEVSPVQALRNTEKTTRSSRMGLKLVDLANNVFGPGPCRAEADAAITSAVSSNDYKRVGGVLQCCVPNAPYIDRVRYSAEKEKLSHATAFLSEGFTSLFEDTEWFETKSSATPSSLAMSYKAIIAQAHALDVLFKNPAQNGLQVHMTFMMPDPETSPEYYAFHPGVAELEFPSEITSNCEWGTCWKPPSSSSGQEVRGSLSFIATQWLRLNDYAAFKYPAVLAMLMKYTTAISLQSVVTRNPDQMEAIDGLFQDALDNEYSGMRDVAKSHYFGLRFMEYGNRRRVGLELRAFSKLTMAYKMLPRAKYAMSMDPTKLLPPLHPHRKKTDEERASMLMSSEDLSLWNAEQTLKFIPASEDIVKRFFNFRLSSSGGRTVGGICLTDKDPLYGDPNCRPFTSTHDESLAKLIIWAVYSDWHTYPSLQNNNEAQTKMARLLNVKRFTERCWDPWAKAAREQYAVWRSHVTAAHAAELAVEEGSDSIEDVSWFDDGRSVRITDPEQPEQSKKQTLPSGLNSLAQKNYVVTCLIDMIGEAKMHKFV